MLLYDRVYFLATLLVAMIFAMFLGNRNACEHFIACALALVNDSSQFGRVAFAVTTLYLLLEFFRYVIKRAGQYDHDIHLVLWASALKIISIIGNFVYHSVCICE